jgi:cytochrome P450
MDVNFNSPQVIADPWPILGQIREAGPMVWNRSGHWMTAQDSICRQILNKPGPLGTRGTMAAIFGSEAFICIDDRPRHNALRNVWVGAFRRESVDALTPVVRQFVDRMLDSVESDLRKGIPVDITSALCAPLPPSVTAHMLGIPAEMLSSILSWSDDIANATSGGWPIDFEHDPAWRTGEEAKRNLAEYIYEQIKYRRQHPGRDLISQLVHSEVAKTVSEEALMMNIRQLLFGGSETTQKWLGHIVLTLGRMRDLREELIHDPASLPAALEEIMRWETVVQTDPRTVSGSDVAVAGVPLEDGAEVILLLGGANRDPSRYPDPDRLNIHREQKAHLGFGFGLHSCLGVTIARLEALVATRALLERFPGYAIVEPIGYTSFNLRGPGPVRVVLE